MKANQTAFYGVGIFVPVTNLERSTKWYTEMLGFEITHRDEPHAMVMKLNDEKIVFCLVRSDEVRPLVFPKNDYSVEGYFNFHTRDVGGVHGSLKAKGAHVMDIHEFDGGMRGFTLYDPDGNRFGIV